MHFDLSDELADLQRSVRRLAQDKIKPRAREIDKTSQYPQDIFEAFRDAELLGLCIPADGIDALLVTGRASIRWPARYCPKEAGSRGDNRSVKVAAG